MTIAVDHLWFSYDKLPVLEDISLNVKKGEFIGIFGPNGGGKTTFLNLLIGRLKPDSGTLKLLGHSPEEVRDKIGYVPQVKRFDRKFPISVLDVVLQGALSKLSWLGYMPAKVRQHGRDVLQRVGLQHKEKDAFGTLSGGEMQRVLIARALVGDPEILLLDEATAHVDASAAEQIIKILLQLKGEITILMVTHDLQMMVNQAGRLICIQKTLTSYGRQEVCSHFSLGLYHPPKTTDV